MRNQLEKFLNGDRQNERLCKLQICKPVQKHKSHPDTCCGYYAETGWHCLREYGAENVNHPFHYQGKYECIDEMVALFGVDAVRHFCMCNVYKYRFRASRKNGPEDIEKAEWYMGKLMELNQEVKER